MLPSVIHQLSGSHNGSHLYRVVERIKSINSFKVLRTVSGPQKTPSKSLLFSSSAYTYYTMNSQPNIHGISERNNLLNLIK